MAGFIGENRLSELLTLIKNKFVANDSYATASTAGIVKPDGTTISVNASGVISSTSAISGINDIGDVNIISPANDQVLAYNSSSSKWINKDNKAVQRSTMPTASASEVGNIYQYIGTTTSSFTNGFFYECISDSGTYSWRVKPIESIKISAVDFNNLTQEQKDNGTAYYIYDEDEATTKSVMGFTPVGTVISVMGIHAPMHYLICNGQIVNIADYPELANYFENEFGSKNKFGGDGVTTFAVPDLRGEFLRGTGTNSHATSGNGAAVGTHQASTEINPWWFNNTYGGFSFDQTPSATYSGLIKNYDYSHSYGTRKSYAITSELKLLSNTGSGVAFLSVRPTNTSVLYCIATKNIYINPENIYKTEEQVVGTWLDGKPLYQKTIDCGTLPNATSKNVAHNITNLDRVINIKGYATYAGRSTIITLPFVSTSDSNIACYATSSNIFISTVSDRTAFVESYVTIQYTKTTD